jgi:hypothetical protein
MLRIYFLQQWFNLSDPAVEEALYDSYRDARDHRLQDGPEVVVDGIPQGTDGSLTLRWSKPDSNPRSHLQGCEQFCWAGEGLAPG